MKSTIIFTLSFLWHCPIILSMQSLNPAESALEIITLKQQIAQLTQERDDYKLKYESRTDEVKQMINVVQGYQQILAPFVLSTTYPSGVEPVKKALQNSENSQTPKLVHGANRQEDESIRQANWFTWKTIASVFDFDSDAL